MIAADEASTLTWKLSKKKADENYYPYEFDEPVWKRLHYEVIELCKPSELPIRSKFNPIRMLQSNVEKVPVKGKLDKCPKKALTTWEEDEEEYEEVEMFVKEKPKEEPIVVVE